MSSGIVGAFDMNDMAVLAFPTPFLFVNGEADKFDYEDAGAAFEHIRATYEEGGSSERAQLATPTETGHEFSTSLAIEFFSRFLKG